MLTRLPTLPSIFCTLLMSLFCLSNAHSQTNEGELLIVHAEGFFPPNEMLIDGQLQGIHVDLIQAAAKSLQIKVSFRSFPWKRAISMLQLGQADAITYMGKNPEREQFGYFEEGNRLSITQNGFFALKEKVSNLRYSGDVQSLSNFSIGTIRGRAYYPEFDQAQFLKKDDNAADEQQLLRKMLAGRFDLAIGHVSRIKYIAQSMQIDDKLAFLQPYAPPINNYLVFAKAKQHENLARRFASAMTNIKKSSAFQEILKKYQVKAEDF